MGATPEGTICQLGQARGIKKALAKMCDTIIANLKDSKDRILAISHCNCRERAEQVRRMLEAVGHPVIALHREAFGPLELGDVPRGEARQLTDAEVAALREFAS